MNKSVLIVDDDEDIRTLLEYNLSKEGFQTFCAENGVEAIKIAKEVHPDLILLDIMMPEMDGMEVCETLRSTPGFENTYICFLTARGEDYSQVAGLDAGADDYVTKPIKMRVLISRIKAVFRRNLQNGSTNSSNELRINRNKYVVEKGMMKFNFREKNLN